MHSLGISSHPQSYNHQPLTVLPHTHTHTHTHTSLWQSLHKLYSLTKYHTAHVIQQNTCSIVLAHHMHIITQDILFENWTQDHWLKLPVKHFVFGLWRMRTACIVQYVTLQDNATSHNHYTVDRTATKIGRLTAIYCQGSREYRTLKRSFD